MFCRVLGFRVSRYLGHCFGEILNSQKLQNLQLSTRFDFDSFVFESSGSRDTSAMCDSDQMWLCDLGPSVDSRVEVLGCTVLVRRVLKCEKPLRLWDCAAETPCGHGYPAASERNGETFRGLLPERQDQNLALTVFYLPRLLASSHRAAALCGVSPRIKPFSQKLWNMCDSDQIGLYDLGPPVGSRVKVLGCTVPVRRVLKRERP